MRKTRDQILQAVKDAAHQKSIGTIGQNRFTTVTGIGEAEWKYYWPRWNDVLTEAGLAPGSKMKKRDDTELVASLIPLIRERGKWPAPADFRVYGRRHSCFPDYTTFRNRGNKAILACMLLKYCADKPELNDIVKICEPLTVADQADEKFDSRERIKGYVYLMKSGKFYKIGKSKSPDRRRSEIALLLPDETETLHVIATDDPDGIEQYWHQRFKDKHYRGEFFQLNNADVKAFKRRKDYM